MDIYEKEREIQNEIGYKYDSVYKNLIVHNKRWEFIYKRIKKYFKKNEKNLEIGCGTAEFLSFLEKKGFSKLMGCDLSDKTINYACEKVKSAEFKVANMINLPYEDSSIDNLVFMGSLHHLPFDDIELAINESVRVLRENGYLLISDFNSVFEDIKVSFFVKIIRKLFGIKNSRRMQKQWLFNPNDKNLYTEAHTHKSKIDYINIAMSTNRLTLHEEIINEHFVNQFDGVLFSNSKIDNLTYKVLESIDNFIKLEPRAHLMLIFKKK